jgi:hypothetical protein
MVIGWCCDRLVLFLFSVMFVVKRSVKLHPFSIAFRFDDAALLERPTTTLPVPLSVLGVMRMCGGEYFPSLSIK